MTDTVEVTLKPCPFCGNDGSGPIEHALHVSMIEHDWKAASWSVQCDKCTATMGYSDSKDEAIDAWNMRHAATRELEADKVEIHTALRRLIKTCEGSSPFDFDEADLALEHARNVAAKHTEATQ